MPPPYSPFYPSYPAPPPYNRGSFHYEDGSTFVQDTQNFGTPRVPYTGYLPSETGNGPSTQYNYGPSTHYDYDTMYRQYGPRGASQREENLHYVYHSPEVPKGYEKADLGEPLSQDFQSGHLSSKKEEVESQKDELQNRSESQQRWNRRNEMKNGVDDVPDYRWYGRGGRTVNVPNPIGPSNSQYKQYLKGDEQQGYNNYFDHKTGEEDEFSMETGLEFQSIPCPVSRGESHYGKGHTKKENLEKGDVGNHRDTRGRETQNSRFRDDRKNDQDDERQEKFSQKKDSRDNRKNDLGGDRIKSYNMRGNVRSHCGVGKDNEGVNGGSDDNDGSSGGSTGGNVRINVRDNDESKVGNGGPSGGNGGRNDERNGGGKGGGGHTRSMSENNNRENVGYSGRSNRLCEGTSEVIDNILSKGVQRNMEEDSGNKHDNLSPSTLWTSRDFHREGTTHHIYEGLWRRGKEILNEEGKLDSKKQKDTKERMKDAQNAKITDNRDNRKQLKKFLDSKMLQEATVPPENKSICRETEKSKIVIKVPLQDNSKTFHLSDNQTEKRPGMIDKPLIDVEPDLNQDKENLLIGSLHVESNTNKVYTSHGDVENLNYNLNSQETNILQPNFEVRHNVQDKNSVQSNSSDLEEESRNESDKQEPTKEDKTNSEITNQLKQFELVESQKDMNARNSSEDTKDERVPSVRVDLSHVNINEALITRTENTNSEGNLDNKVTTFNNLESDKREIKSIGILGNLDKERVVQTSVLSIGPEFQGKAVVEKYNTFPTDPIRSSNQETTLKVTSNLKINDVDGKFIPRTNNNDEEVEVIPADQNQLLIKFTPNSTTKIEQAVSGTGDATKFLLVDKGMGVQTSVKERWTLLDTIPSGTNDKQTPLTGLVVMRPLSNSIQPVNVSNRGMICTSSYMGATNFQKKPKKGKKKKKNKK
eukprot:TRINITY_DN9617_c3_g1_i1.p1 TRINITY_DN9617_c3_g1~~TRINITY_DN9617_c3_g1_i1.p1  ORF type:complete len:1026 (+),score=233.01 TRINITY_DN9617_c3_g1_i1:293-3079(+)